MINRNLSKLFLLTLTSLAIFAGCSDDGPTGPTIIANSVVITANPGGVDFPWRLNLPDGGYVIGAGDSTFIEMSSGDYEIQWRIKPGYINVPADETKNLTSGNSISFSGAYDNDLQRALTPDILMNNFKLVYEGMAPAAYASLLSADHRTMLLPETVGDWAQSENPLPVNFFDYAQTVVIHENIFGWLCGLNSQGLPVPLVESIGISVLDKQNVWNPADPDDEYFGGRDAYFAPYNVLMHFNKPDGSRFEVDQRIDFYVEQDNGGLCSRTLITSGLSLNRRGISLPRPWLVITRVGAGTRIHGPGLEFIYSAAPHAICGAAKSSLVVGFHSIPCYDFPDIPENAEALFWQHYPAA